MSVAITLALSVVYFGVGGWSVWRVNRLLPKPLMLNGRPMSFGGWPVRIFVWSIVFLVATAPVYAAGYVLAFLLN
jgi:hypothetical protein